MRKTFTALETRQVTIRRGPGEEQTFALTAPPVGYHTWLRVVFPPPEEYANGKPADVGAAKRGDYNERFNLALLAKCLRSDDGAFEATEPSTGGRAAWVAYTDALRAELQAANFSEGDLYQLLMPCLELLSARDVKGIEAASGN